MTSDAPAPERRYHERRGLSTDFGLVAVLSLGVLVYAGYGFLSQQRDWMDAALLVLVVLGPMAFTIAMFFSRYGPELAHVAVDDQGVWVRQHLLPADQIGKVWEIGSGKGARIHFSSSIDGNHLLRGICSYSFFAGARTAVYVEQTRDDAKPRPWLIGTDHPEQLAATVRQLRHDAGGPTVHPDDRPGPADHDPADREAP
jgi:hypothetical protein